MDTLKYMEEHGHEQLIVCSDPSVGLRGFIAIHDTTLGPSCGGTRMWPYRNEEEALTDVLRLSRAMSFKSAAAGLALGGGKGVIWADPNTQKTEVLLRAYARFVDTLGGRYVTTTDVGTTMRDLEYIRMETKHVVGLPDTLGGSGDTSVLTGLGVYLGMKACAREAWGKDSLEGKAVAMQGFGKVASHTAEHLLKEGVRIIATDTSQAAKTHAKEMGAEIVDTDAIYDTPCDIFSPCALGGTLNSETIPQLKCSIVAGGANNQLLTEEDGERLQKRGILYAPDYIINAGGIINASCEIGATYSRQRATELTERIYETLLEVLRSSSIAEITPAQAADRLASQRIEAVRAMKGLRRCY